MTFPSSPSPDSLHSLLGGWQISDLTSFQSGTPFSIVNTQNADNAGTGNTVSNNGQSLVVASTGSVQSYPDIVGPIHGQIAIKHPAGVQGPRLFNSDAFAAPQGLTYGDAGRNVLALPHRTNFDMGLFKNFAVHEAMHFEFRAEAFNIFNHTQWSAVDNSSCYGADNCSTSTFLTATAAHNARICNWPRSSSSRPRPKGDAREIVLTAVVFSGARDFRREGKSLR